MTSKWVTQTLPSDGLPLAEQFVVLLLYGKNSFDDKIYSFVKVNVPNIQNLKTAIQSGQGFNPSDFGEVVAAGRGEPTDQIRAEVASMYTVLDSKPTSGDAKNTRAEAKKNWDEY